MPKANDPSSNDQNLTGQLGAVDLLRQARFPAEWKFRPVLGKKPLENAWNKKPLQASEAVEAYETGFKRPSGDIAHYDGQAVMTGARSGGLIALDIDGDGADQAFAAMAEDAFEPMGEETSMAITSGRPGRRQIFYKVPSWIIPELEHLCVHKILEDVDGSGELALRFNSAYSVLPGSIHPDTGNRYRFTRDKDEDVPGVVDAPAWIMEILEDLRKLPSFESSFLPVEIVSEALEEIQPGVLPDNQLRGWFWKKEIQSMVGADLMNVIYHQTVLDAEWNTSNPLRVANYCPFHGGDSGDSFHVDITGDKGYGWHCKVCGTGGNPLQYLHAINEADPRAPMPTGLDLRRVIEGVAARLGLTYPDDLMPVGRTEIIEGAREKMSVGEFYGKVRLILATTANEAACHLELMDLAVSCGRARSFRNGAEIVQALNKHDRLAEQEKPYDVMWQAKARNNRRFLIPDFIASPSTIMLHARGGVGKTRVAIALAKIIGKGEELIIREVPIKPSITGTVLLIGNDMNEVDYAEYLDSQNIRTDETDRWLICYWDWQQDEYTKIQNWIKKHKPALVIIDSLTSSSIETGINENDSAYAHTMYKLGKRNGKDFPFTTFLWLHHDTKDGSGFRGSDSLRNAAHEFWHLKQPDEEQAAQYGHSSLILSIDKGRSSGKEGSSFLVEQFVDETLSLRDLTPAEERYNNGAGNLKPRTLAFAVVKDSPEPMTAYEVKTKLMGRLFGQGAPIKGELTLRTVRRWLDSWVGKGLLIEGPARETGEKGRPAGTYALVGGPLPSTKEKIPAWCTPSTKAPEEAPEEALEEAPEEAPEEEPQEEPQEAPEPKSEAEVPTEEPDPLPEAPRAHRWSPGAWD